MQLKENQEEERMQLFESPCEGTLVVNVNKLYEQVQFCVFFWNWANFVELSQLIVRMLCASVSHHRIVMFEGTLDLWTFRSNFSREEVERCLAQAGDADCGDRGFLRSILS